MIKYLITFAMLCSVIIAASGTIWLNQEPDYLQLGSQFATPLFKPANISPFEIINAPYFPLLGEGFYTNTAPLQPKSQQPIAKINSSGIINDAIPIMDFSGNFENNLKYAASKSSLRIGQGSSSTTLNTPWLIK
jgi:hypothetical protein